MATTQNKDVHQAELLPEAMFGSVAQLLFGSVLTSVAHIASRTNSGAWDLGQNLGLVWSKRATPTRGHTDMVACATIRD